MLMSLNSIGIKFTEDISTINDRISGYRIVRADKINDHMSRCGTATILVIDKRENYFDIAGGAGKTINTLYEVFADSVLFINIEEDPEQIEYDRVPIGAVYHV